jgi:hypothetical protein
LPKGGWIGAAILDRVRSCDLAVHGWGLSYNFFIILLHKICGKNGKKTTQFIVNTYHHINHSADDVMCCTWCNPNPLDGSAPNVVISVVDKDGRPALKCAFITQVSCLEIIKVWLIIPQACEQLNSWLSRFESILKHMVPSNFNWFLHVMLFYHTKYVIEKQKKKKSTMMKNENDI